ncbi:abortive infection family protein [Chryseobacterium daecheongense]|uniref:Abortive infection Abi-like protein n=1 Tax=Chryseobacterium daecheongense TaxID=192389 RepID=A0A3N0VZ65_9FLAO|nr:abortive infection family protein [Chryseobacterium daecheongense]ROH98094.1 hypothetical protein EGI05_12200 [Chryseobacterium daecheongense]TDX92706.1 abortive infection Abi-like protein [Chryseobacterium daecheongense]
MAELNYQEKETIEDFLGMKSGYVMDFSNRTFQEFIYKAVKKDIYDPIYQYASCSKANLLRKFIEIENSSIVGKLIEEFCSYWYAKSQRGSINRFKGDEYLYKETLKIVEKLKIEKIVENIEAIKPNNFDDKDFETLAKNIRESIERNEPELSIDRLHTFTFKYIRILCKKHNIDFKKEESLNSIFGKYVKYLFNQKLLESEMTEKILKYSINILDAFNDVRNNKSLAHDNPILNYDESLLILNNISTAIRFIEKIELQIDAKNIVENTETGFDLPF